MTCLIDYVNDPFIPQRGRRRPADSLPMKRAQRLTMTTHYNGREKASAMSHQIHQSPVHRSYDRVDNIANFPRFLRRLQNPDTSAAANSNDGGDNDIDNGSDNTKQYADEGLDLQASQQPLQWQEAMPIQMQPSAHNLSPVSGRTSTITHQSAASSQRNASRDTFYLARGSHIHQAQSQ